MPSTTDEDQLIVDPGMFDLFIGESGTGKSTAALSFPSPFVLDFDKKMPTIAKKHFPGKKVDWECFDDIFQVSDFLMPWLSGEECPYETLIADSITTLSTLCLNSVGKTKGEDVMKQLKTRVKTKSGDMGIEVMSYDYYNGEANFFERYFIDALRSLWARPGNPKHVIVLAHVVTVESAPDMRTKVVTRTRQIVTAGRKVAAFIPTRFDEMYRFGWETPELGDELNKPKNIVITYQLGEENAKTAFPFPPRIDFTGKNFYDLLQSYIKNPYTL